MPNWLSLPVEMFANLGGSLVDKHCLVSEPDPWKNLKEGLGGVEVYRVGFFND